MPLSEGKVLARACLFNDRRHTNLPSFKVEGDGVDRERARLSRAREATVARLAEIERTVEERVGMAEAGIFMAQRMMVEDDGLFDKIDREVIQGGLNAEMAVAKVLDAYETMVSGVDDEYIKERATDIGEIKRRLLDVLRNMNPALQCGGSDHCQRGRDRIVVAEELTPSLTVDLDTEHTIGFVTERGGPGSHAAILARALGIPAVSGVKGIHSLVVCGAEVLIDGSTGTVVVWPSEDTVHRYAGLDRAGRAERAPVAPVAGFRVMANISHAGEVDDALRFQAEGIGLYRTEFEFLREGRALTEEEQFERYARVVEAVRPQAVTFRLLDIGGDKAAAFLNLPKEENPYLGFRGSRLLLGRPALLRDQARALARASRLGSVNAMYPMVTGLDQLRRLKALFADAIRDLEPGDLRQGVMFEVPSACLEARAILAEADFASIGTNDLIQYLFAVDRNNELVAADYCPDHEVLWALIADLAAAARAIGRPLSVCGEVAANPAYVHRIAEAGITRVSVSPRLIPRARLAAQRLASDRSLGASGRRVSGSATETGSVV
ncbi:MAG TPA: phosphoenolpyruvate--protein phosphotransferase [Candidatus Hydrogenedentes bacterium]|nr:phosphoenolpyruvate--protein phosphotransferase [Candidatus Hydrogenedentota bacterium]HPG67492.1 phosphoenolpyruvate--protein phosphotransferase [Candidatus Hydrogenedentota bacterium]